MNDHVNHQLLKNLHVLRGSLFVDCACFFVRFSNHSNQGNEKKQKRCRYSYGACLKVRGHWYFGWLFSSCISFDVGKEWSWIPIMPILMPRFIQIWLRFRIINRTLTQRLIFSKFPEITFWRLICLVEMVNLWFLNTEYKCFTSVGCSAYNSESSDLCFGTKYYYMSSSNNFWSECSSNCFH